MFGLETVTNHPDSSGASVQVFRWRWDPTTYEGDPPSFPRDGFYAGPNGTFVESPSDAQIVSGGPGAKGDPGQPAWRALWRDIKDGAKVIREYYDWTNPDVGASDKPFTDSTGVTTSQYDNKDGTGFTATKADALDIRAPRNVETLTIVRVTAQSAGTPSQPTGGSFDFDDRTLTPQAALTAPTGMAENTPGQLQSYHAEVFLRHCYSGLLYRDA